MHIALMKRTCRASLEEDLESRAQGVPEGSGSWLAGCAEDTLAERLRRRPAKRMGSPRVGSNPTGVDLQGAAGNGAEAAEYECTSKTRVGNVMEATKNRERGCSRNTGQMFLPRK